MKTSRHLDESSRWELMRELPAGDDSGVVKHMGYDRKMTAYRTPLAVDGCGLGFRFSK